MSVLVTMRVAGDTNQFRQFVEQEGDKLRELAEEAKRQGCLHHRFGVGDGFVVVIDEWESAEQFQQFFSDPRIAEVMQGAGAQGEPEFTFSEAHPTPDEF